MAPESTVPPWEAESLSEETFRREVLQALAYQAQALHRIASVLEALATPPTQGSPVRVYVCRACGEQCSGEAKALEHAVGKHGAPKADWRELYGSSDE